MRLGFSTNSIGDVDPLHRAELVDLREEVGRGEPVGARGAVDAAQRHVLRCAHENITVDRGDPAAVGHRQQASGSRRRARRARSGSSSVMAAMAFAFLDHLLGSILYMGDGGGCSASPMRTEPDLTTRA